MGKEVGGLRNTKILHIIGTDCVDVNLGKSILTNRISSKSPKESKKCMFMYSDNQETWSPVAGM